MRAAVLTVSDRGAAGQTVDRSGPRLSALLTEAGFDVVAYDIVPDEHNAIESRLRQWANMAEIALICSTGGTGPAPRDITPDVTRSLLERELPGFGEAMRAASTAITPLGMLSRSTAGIFENTLIINFPGSPKAVEECFAVVRPVLRHTIELIGGGASQHVTSAGG